LRPEELFKEWGIREPLFTESMIEVLKGVSALQTFLLQKNIT